MRRFTDNQRRVLAAIEECWQAREVPTYQAIADRACINTLTSVTIALKSLLIHGYITQTDKPALTKTGQAKLKETKEAEA